MPRSFHFLILLLLLPAGFSGAAETALPVPAFTAGDRVLVLAPHPDDEMFGAGGAMAEAAAAGADVKVVLLTNGENNKLSFFVYQKRWIFSREKSLELGRMRKAESLKALQSIGLGEGDLISLGYPDFGTLKILTQYWGGGKPYASLAARAERVPFAEDFSPGAAYTGENILADLTEILEGYRPTKIFVSHPADENRDHRALYLFLRIALWDLEGRIEAPAVYPYLVHLNGWPAPGGYDPERKQAVPLELQASDLVWHRLPLEPGVVARKHAAIQQYPSQLQYMKDVPDAFARASELFGRYPDVALRPQGQGEIDWQWMQSYNPLLREEKTAQRKFIDRVGYARQGDDLLVRVELKYLRNRITGISLALLGYRKGEPFAAMPKIEILTRFWYVTVKDKCQRISKKEINVDLDGKTATFRVPLALLGNPDFILTSARTRRVWDMSIDETAWRVLTLE